MTLDEAVKDVITEIQGRFGAVRAAQNGRAIHLPDGRVAHPVQPPGLGDLLLTTLKAQLVLIQCVNYVSGLIQGGFALSDQEASRIADLVLERIKALDTLEPQGVASTHEVIPTAIAPQEAGTESPR